MEQHKRISLYGILTIFNTFILCIFAVFFFRENVSADSIPTAENGKPLFELTATEQGGMLVLRDTAGTDRLYLQGGETSAVMLNNPQGELVATLFTGHDSSGTFGVADAGGNVSALMKGGPDASLSFFQGAAYPALSLGITDAVPHVLFFSPNREQLILHGGAHNSLLFIDENGAVSLSLTKSGIKQEKESLAQRVVIPYKIEKPESLISLIE